MVKLDMFSKIAKQLAKARGLIGESTTMFRRLPIVIFIKDFYQFFPIIARPLWNKVCKKEDHYSKML